MPETDQLMLSVARLRTAGESWAQIAELLPRAADTMSHWPYKRADEWRAALVRAIDEALGTYENEALLVCRQHLRTGAEATGADKQLAQIAARDLLRHCRELRGRRMKLEVSGPDGGPLLSTTDLIGKFTNGQASKTPEPVEPDEAPDGPGGE